MNAPIDTGAQPRAQAEQSTVAKAATWMDSRFGPSWLRWPIVGSVLLCGGGGVIAWSPDASEVEALEGQVDALEANVDALETEVDVLEAQAIGNAAQVEALTGQTLAVYEMAAIALELSVDGQRYLIDVLVDVAKLDHPDYQPPGEDPRLDRKKTRGGQLLDSLGTPKP
jgi:outer membrane murein-binding lipoprotein Lpp